MEKPVYIALILDRHADPSVNVFAIEGDAIAFARKKAKEYCRFPEDREEKIFTNDVDDTIFQVTYSCESDRVIVYKKTVEE